jgi:hypothetical protein
LRCSAKKFLHPFKTNNKMNTALWIMQGVLAALFLMPATMKLITPKAKMLEKGQLKPGESVAPIRALGAVEWLGIIGIIVPWLTGILPVLTPITAVCFAIIMIGAFVVHFKKKEYKLQPLIVIAFGLSVTVAYFRF